MTPFTVLEGVMAVMPRTNINTDAIIPSPWLRSATLDLGKGLFAGLRYDEEGRERPDFVLNRPPFRDARILLADENFGCGSSREAAVWALEQFGIRCVLAPSFADIFRENAFRNGVLAARIEPGAFVTLQGAVQGHPDRPIFRVDLPARRVTGPDGWSCVFEVPAARAEALIKGEDEIGATLRLVDQIDAFLADARTKRPWLYPAAKT
jgi:3-isopropylmalate/(R)-2-methylmalate dehydratase small subunit